MTKETDFEANARLIAAALELLDALKKYGAHKNECGVNNYRIACKCDCGLAAAIAKATGEHYE